jgi:competence ComEA-like helix-hairpin-helix protein
MKPVKFLKEYFNFSKGEKNGILFLMVIIVFLLFLPGIYKLFRVDEKTDFTVIKKQIEEFCNSYTMADSSLSDQNNAVSQSDSLFRFDPNETDNEKWSRLGVSQKLISIINNYRKKGGRFNKKSDLKNIYGFPDSIYGKLEPYIEIDSMTRSEKTMHVNGKNSNFRLFRFDPNTASDEDFNDLGLTKQQIKVIRNYQSKGGKFVKKEDFAVIYVISPEQFHRLEPYINIQAEENKPDTVTSVNALIVEINSADTTELMQIKGIGKTLGSRILSYRTKLGGFVKKEQLLEVFGMKKDTYERIANQVTVDATTVKKININFAPAYELDRHPYLNYRQAKAVEQFRIQKGSYSSVSQLLEKNILTVETYNKIKDYLVVE